MSTLNQLQKQMLNILLDRYERSRMFLGINRNMRLPQFEMAKIYPVYTDDSEYSAFCECNEAVAGLEKAGLVIAEYGRGGVIERVLLCVDELEAAYRAVSRIPRAGIQAELKSLIENELISPLMSEEYMAPLSDYLREQLQRIEENKDVEYYDGDMQDYKYILLMAREVLCNEEECFIRDFSVRLFQDSKKAEGLCGRVESLLYAYGEYAEKKTVLEEHGILRTPTYVMLKGAAKILIGKQSIELKALGGDIAFSTESLRNIVHIEVNGSRVITVENLTSFHDFRDTDALVVYLGGFHNRAKRLLLKKIYEDNPDIAYKHFGDIDAGGLYILEHLKEKTGIPFEPLYMDCETLLRYRTQAVSLSSNDRKRLKKLKERRLPEPVADLVDCMLSENIKLEQEAVRVQGTD